MTSSKTQFPCNSTFLLGQHSINLIKILNLNWDYRYKRISLCLTYKKYLIHFKCCLCRHQYTKQAKSIHQLHYLWTLMHQWEGLLKWAEFYNTFCFAAITGDAQSLLWTQHSGFIPSGMCLTQCTVLVPSLMIQKHLHQETVKLGGQWSQILRVFWVHEQQV